MRLVSAAACASVAPLDEQALDLIGVFGLLSVLAVGGGAAVLPGDEAADRSQHHWVTETPIRPHLQPRTARAGPEHADGRGDRAVRRRLDRARSRRWSPSAAGQHVDLGGRAGSGSGWPDWPWLDAIQRGLGPVSIGLALSGAITVAKGAVINVTTLIIAAAVLTILLRRHVNPAYLIVASGVAGALLLRAVTSWLSIA